MSAPLGKAILVAGSTEHVLKRARLGALDLTTDLAVFRPPFGTKWHKLGTGQAAPEHLEVSGAIEEATLALSRAALDALHADLPAIDTLRIGTWSLAVDGTSGPVVITPTLGGHRVQLTLIRSD